MAWAVTASIDLLYTYHQQYYRYNVSTLPSALACFEHVQLKCSINTEVGYVMKVADIAAVIKISPVKQVQFQYHEISNCMPDSRAIINSLLAQRPYHLNHHEDQAL